MRIAIMFTAMLIALVLAWNVEINAQGVENYAVCSYFEDGSMKCVEISPSVGP